MRPGESRRLRALLPVINQVGEIRMEAAAFEATPLAAGTQTLLRINVTTDLGTAQMKSVVWTDEQGKPQKVKDLQLGMEAFPDHAGRTPCSPAREAASTWGSIRSYASIARCRTPIARAASSIGPS